MSYDYEESIKVSIVYFEKGLSKILLMEYRD
jgi:hypothetical protein